jgi:methylated-DNA-protein-cysteine methyltransferase-like protein
MAHIAALADPQAYMALVWDIVRLVPAGQVTTFGQIASMIPPPPVADEAEYERMAPRYVGDAMNAVSWRDEATVPWHRVINSRGQISLPPDSKSAALQRARLRADGVLEGDSETVDLGRFGWEGPPVEWLSERGLRPPKPLRRPPDDRPQQMALF